MNILLLTVILSVSKANFQGARHLYTSGTLPFISPNNKHSDYFCPSNKNVRYRNKMNIVKLFNLTSFRFVLFCNYGMGVSSLVH